MDRKDALRKAYGQATNDLREKYPEDFATFYSERAKALGQEWHPRLSPEQKAAQEFDRLVAEFPFLADRLPRDTSPDAERGAQAS